MFWLASQPGWTADLVVDARSPHTGADGSIARPFRSIQAAVTAAGSGDRVLVASGTYREDVLIEDKSVSLLGGYPGAPAATYQAGGPGDFTASQPTLHSSIIEGTADAYALELRATGETPGVEDVRIEGFIIQGGRRGLHLSDGTGRYTGLRRISIVANTIANNGRADAPEDNGGGLHLEGSHIVVARNRVVGNRSGNGAGLWGEGINLTIEHNLIATNEARGYFGGGVALQNAGTTATLRFNTIQGNVARSTGGGLWIGPGVQATLGHELIVGNAANANGTAMTIEGNSELTTRVDLQHATVVANRYAPGPDDFNDQSPCLLVHATLHVRNSIFWNNSEAVAPFFRDVYLIPEVPASLQISHCLTERPWPGFLVRQCDPLFADPGNGDYHLKSTAGRWLSASTNWVQDSKNSPGLDVGDPVSDWSREPSPNGGQANLGNHGNTPEASKSPFAGPNRPPANLELADRKTAENNRPDSVVGLIRFDDPDPNDRHEVALVAGPGGEDNALFFVDFVDRDDSRRRALRTRVRFDFEGKQFYRVRLRVVDWRGLLVEDNFELGVTNQDDPPSATFLAPAPGTRVSPGDALLLRATVSDQDSTVERVEFRANGQRIAQATREGGEWSAVWRPTQPGRVVLSAVPDVTADGLVQPARVTVTVAAPELAPAPGVPARWESRGIGGGGAFYAPSINPHNPDEIYVASDMSDLFRSADFGETWETVDFRQVQGGGLHSWVQFTRDPAVLYARDHWAEGRARRSGDGGLTWEDLAIADTNSDFFRDGKWAVFASRAHTDRLLVADYSSVRFSTDGGREFSFVTGVDDFPGAENSRMAGAFFTQDLVFVGVRHGLFVSVDGGASFAGPWPGLPPDEYLFSMAGAREGDSIRLFGVTVSEVDHVVDQTNYPEFRNLYRLNYAPGARWERMSAVTNDVPEVNALFVAMAHDNLEVAYLNGQSRVDGRGLILKTVNGGVGWTQIFHQGTNRNIRTGWIGDQGLLGWGFADPALALNVCPTDAERVVVTDMMTCHVSADGGRTWRAAYVPARHLNPAGQPTRRDQAYRGQGLEDTTCWGLTWIDATNVLADFADLGGLRSRDGGRTWTLTYANVIAPAGFPEHINTTYHTVCDTNTGHLYAAVSTLHDLYEEAGLEGVGNHTGAILYSTDQAASWTLLHDFGHPVVWLGLDPVNTNRLWAAVAHDTEGGAYSTTNLSAGDHSTWTRVSGVAPRTETNGFIAQVHALRDGTLVAVHSARVVREMIGTNVHERFLPISGVFVSTNQGATWRDRSHTSSNMHYWTRDLVVDTNDPAQNTWYASVCSGWGLSPHDLGGLYRTTDRGTNWSRIFTFEGSRIRSCTVHPANSNLLYVATMENGLFVSTNAQAAQPDFHVVTGYPFKYPTRVVFNPHDKNEVWVASYGNALRVGYASDLHLSFDPVHSSSDGRFRARLRVNRDSPVHVESSDDLESWIGVFQGDITGGALEFEDPIPNPSAVRFYRARGL